MLVAEENENEIRLCVDARSTRNFSCNLVPHESSLASHRDILAFGTARPQASHHGMVRLAVGASAPERMDSGQALPRRIFRAP